METSHKAYNICLYVDDFRITYYNTEDAQHILQKIGKDYKYIVDWDCKNFCWLTFEWHYRNWYVDVSIPGYIQDILRKLKHVKKDEPQYSLHEHFLVHYTKHDEIQDASAPETSRTLEPNDTKYIQSVIGTLLYYTWTLDGTLQPALNRISTQKSAPTKKTIQK